VETPLLELHGDGVGRRGRLRGGVRRAVSVAGRRRLDLAERLLQRDGGLHRVDGRLELAARVEAAQLLQRARELHRRHLRARDPAVRQQLVDCRAAMGEPDRSVSEPSSAGIELGRRVRTVGPGPPRASAR
jgi:hypothetical protein